MYIPVKIMTMNLKPGEYFVLSVHREENVDYPENFSNLLESINAVAEKYKMRIIFSTHPRTRIKLEEQSHSFSPLVEFQKPLGFADYIKLQQHAFCVISDSDTITEESALLGFPAITIRQAHERPEGMDVGTLIMSGLKTENIINAIDVVTNQQKISSVSRMVPDYDTDSVSQKVVRIILSYTDYIKRTVWKENK